MFGQLKGRFFPALMMVPIMAMALSTDVWAQSWQLERERGVGGRAPAKMTAEKDEAGRSDKRAGVEIVIESENQRIIRPAEGGPVKPPSNEQATKPISNPKAVVAVAQKEAAAAAAALESSKKDLAAGTRSTPPTAVELMGGSPKKPIETEATPALPSAQPSPRPAGRLRIFNGGTDQVPAPIEQTQFAPNAGAEPKAILPHAGEAPSDQAAAPVIMPSPRKPMVLKATVQKALHAPSVGASPKDAAPTPDNAMAELMETPSDHSLSVSAGTVQVLNLDKPVSDVSVADPNIADVNILSPTQIVVHGNQLGRTNIFGLSGGGDVVFAIDVDTVANADVAAAKMQDATPDSATHMSLNSAKPDADGEVAGVGEAIEVATVADEPQPTRGATVNTNTVEESQQVDIQVHFAEVSRNDVFNLGVNWDVLADTGDFLFGLSTGDFLAAGSDLLRGDVENVGEEFGRLDSNGQVGDVSIDAFVDALQREGVVNVLAEPNLTSVNGEAANVLAGSEIPILVPGGGGDGSETVTIDYKPFGVSLDFTPTILPGERINLRVRPEVSSISQVGAMVIDGFSVPAFTVRRAETDVELTSGQTFAIAGLFQRDLATDTDKFPVLGDVPVLGQLFRSQRFKRHETELVILITPHLVKPNSNRNIALPNDRLDQPARPQVKDDKNRAGFVAN